MKKLRSIVALLIAAAILVSFAACGSKGNGADSSKVSSAASGNSESESYTAVDMTVACLKGPTGVGMAKLMSDAEEKKTANNYTFTVASAPDELSGKIVSGEINIASVPTNLAAKLAAKTNGQIVMLAVNTLGVLSIIENGDSIKSIADLKGKTIYSTGEGSNPEYILRYILEQNGIDSKTDVTIKFLVSNDELNAKLISGEAEVAMVPEPAATVVLTKKDTLKRVLSVNDEWDKVSESRLMMGCVVAKASYISENKAAVDKFLEEYKNSVDFAKSDIDSAAAACEKYGIVPAAAIAKAAIPNCNLTFVTGTEMKSAITGYFEVLFGADASSIGGAMPSDGFYYNK